MTQLSPTQKQEGFGDPKRYRTDFKQFLKWNYGAARAALGSPSQGARISRVPALVTSGVAQAKRSGERPLDDRGRGCCAHPYCPWESILAVFVCGRDAWQYRKGRAFCTLFPKGSPIVGGPTWALGEGGRGGGTDSLLHASWLKPIMAGLVNAGESGWELGLVGFFSGTRKNLGRFRGGGGSLV